GFAGEAERLGGVALPDLRLVLRLGEDHQPGVRVHVDEPGTDHAPGGVDDAPGLDARRVAAQDADALVLDGDGAVEARGARAVDESPPRMSRSSMLGLLGIVGSIGVRGTDSLGVAACQRVHARVPARGPRRRAQPRPSARARHAWFPARTRYPVRDRELPPRSGL